MDKHVSLHHRPRFFNAVVTPSILYGCGVWTLTKTDENNLRTVQRKMLRSILGKGRSKLEDGTLEPRIEWKRRVTHEAVQVSTKMRVLDWAEESRRRKWRWGGHVARRQDDRWTIKVLSFQMDGTRNIGRPRKRWSDEICKFFTGNFGEDADWVEAAQCRDTWMQLEEEYLKWL